MPANDTMGEKKLRDALKALCDEVDITLNAMASRKKPTNFGALSGRQTRARRTLDGMKD